MRVRPVRRMLRRVRSAIRNRLRGSGAAASLANRLQSLVSRPHDQIWTARMALHRATSALLVYSGVDGRAKRAIRLTGSDRITVVDLDQPGASIRSEVVETVVVVAGTLTDLRFMAGRADELPAARRAVVTVLCSTKVLPLPRPGLAASSDRITGVTLHRGRCNGWVSEISFDRPLAAGAAVRTLGRIGEYRPPSPTAADAGSARPEAASARTAHRLDPVTVNPAGFRKDPDQDVGVLRVVRADEPLTIRLGDRVIVRLPPSGRVSEADVAALRRMTAVAFEWPSTGGVTPPVRDPSPAGDCAVAACGLTLPSLAMAGVPLCAADLPDAGRDLLGPDLAGLMTSVKADSLADELAREEHSVRLRRAVAHRWDALRSYQASADRPAPVLSVILSTRRPAMLAHAFEQLRRQRRVSFEVVLGLHGVDVDVRHVEQLARQARVSCSVMQIPAEVPFGMALNRLAARAAGSVLAKMDDDDWYGPDHLADLLLAREYSRADIVGCVPEFVYLEELDTTVRRRWHTEVFDGRVNGGAMLVDRGVFTEVGGFRAIDTAGEDQLLQADVVAAGGRLYRTQGLGYVLWRRPAGHTWHAPASYFTKTAQRSWPGLYLTGLFDDAPATGRW